MQLSFALLVCTLWVHMDVSLSQDACDTLPDVPHAFVSDQSGKAHYSEGQLIYFECETGYVSSLAISYLCSSQRWVNVRSGKCTLKPCELPDDIRDGSYRIVEGEDFVFGATIEYMCDEGYQMTTKTNTRKCMLNGWSNHVPICEPVSCKRPTEDGLLKIGNLPENDGPIHSQRFITVSCADPRKRLNGSSTLICGNDGTWSDPLPSCEEPKYCGQPPRIANGHSEGFFRHQYDDGMRVEYVCSRGYALDGEAYKSCNAGQWTGEVICRKPRGCGQPPLLDGGDIVGTLEYQYDNGVKVYYDCKRYYTRSGATFKSCENSQWVGEIRCLKPCTVGNERMAENNIAFRYVGDKKLYSRHDQQIEFACTRGVPDGLRSMRQTCRDGEMLLPRCV
ncbi:complement factor H-like [Lampris incognitus]|uniref:complement factor H-like n=1 Tax=Lampris incognitus TaxID=2546036 RepID=UPI0024B5B67A|nr:complement factor H-like [Lampris incognitus]